MLIPFYQQSNMAARPLGRDGNLRSVGVAPHRATTSLPHHKQGTVKQRKLPPVVSCRVRGHKLAHLYFSLQRRGSNGRVTVSLSLPSPPPWPAITVEVPICSGTRIRIRHLSLLIPVALAPGCAEPRFRARTASAGLRTSQFPLAAARW